MPLSSSSARIGAILGILGSGLLIEPHLGFYRLIHVFSLSLLLNPTMLLGLLCFFLLVINGVALVKQLPPWFTILRLILLSGVVLWVLGLIYALFIFGCGDAPCPPFSLGDVFSIFTRYLLPPLGGLSLNFLGIFISRQRSQSKDILPK